MEKEQNRPTQTAGLLKKVTQISGAVLRLTLGIGGAAMVFFALKGNNRQDASGKLKPRP